MSFSNPASEAKAAASEYVRGLLEILGDRDPVQVQGELAGAIEALVSGLDDASLRRPEAPGKWSIIEVVQHLADTEVVYGYRMRKILADPGAAISGYDQDAWARALRYRDASVEQALAQVRALRASNVSLMRSLSEAEWDRAGLHSERGPESVRQIAKLIAAHDLVHRAQIARIKAALD